MIGTLQSATSTMRQAGRTLQNKLQDKQPLGREAKSALSRLESACLRPLSRVLGIFSNKVGHTDLIFGVPSGSLVGL